MYNLRRLIVETNAVCLVQWLLKSYTDYYSSFFLA